MCGPQLQKLQKSNTEPIACVVAFSPRLLHLVLLCLSVRVWVELAGVFRWSGMWSSLNWMGEETEEGGNQVGEGCLPVVKEPRGLLQKK